MVRRHWRLYGDRDLGGAAVRALGETVTVEYGTDALAQYQVASEPDDGPLSSRRASRISATACTCVGASRMLR